MLVHEFRIITVCACILYIVCVCLCLCLACNFHVLLVAVLYVMRV